jgi:hypothetical protein
LADQQWCVATIAREKPEVIRRFVSWHLAAGASQITIYFDDPDDPSIGMLAHLPQVHCVRCTPEFWVSIGSDPNRAFVKRQNAAMQHAYKTARFPWIFICDADELLFVRPPGTVAGILGQQAQDIATVKFSTAERVTVIGQETETFCRLPANRPLLHKVHPPEIAGALLRTRGFVGHSQGKSIHRTGIGGFVVRQHEAHLTGRRPVLRTEIGWRSGGVLLHMMNTSFEDWERKLSFRIGGSSLSPGLQRLLRDIFADGRTEAIRGAFDALYTFSPEAAATCTRAGKLVKPSPDPDHAVARYFPDVPAAQ